MAQIIALIPARAGSKSIPHKNIEKLGNHPLIAYSIAEAKLSENIEDVIVSTDSKEIAEIATHYGASVPFLRPQAISQDDSLDIEFFVHYLDFCKQNSVPIPDLIVHLRPTTPLREVRVIDEAIEYMLKYPQSSALRSMEKTHLTPYKMFKEADGFAAPFLTHEKKEFYNLPRQTFEEAYIPNGYVDIIRPSVLEETGLLHGSKIKIWETQKTADIDIAEDLKEAQKLLEDPAYSETISYLGGINEFVS